jgi:hypothetical protein
MKTYGGVEAQPQIEETRLKNNFEDSGLLRYDATSVDEMKDLGAFTFGDKQSCTQRHTPEDQVLSSTAVRTSNLTRNNSVCL